MAAVFEPIESAVDALLRVSVALEGLTERSLRAGGQDLTMPEFRTLRMLASEGPRRPADVSTRLQISGPAVTRICDRLADRGLIRRQRPAGDRRAVRLLSTEEGRALVEEISRRRRERLTEIVSATADYWRPEVAVALLAFAAAAAEHPDLQ
jgi:DNA-binding MarR family transcriptional regulator